MGSYRVLRLLLAVFRRGLISIAHQQLQSARDLLAARLSHIPRVQPDSWLQYFLMAPILAAAQREFLLELLPADGIEIVHGVILVLVHGALAIAIEYDRLVSRKLPSCVVAWRRCATIGGLLACLLEIRIRILFPLLCLCVLNLDRGDTDQRSRLRAVRIAIHEGGLDLAVAGFVSVDPSTFPLVWRSFQVLLLLSLNEKVGSSKVAIDDSLGRPLLVV